MTRTFFDRELETAATFWRIFRRDGVTLGFTSHDRDLTFGGIRHRSAPGMVPTAVRLSSDLSEENAGVEGALSHDTIRERDLAAGLFDNAAIEVGVVDWETLKARVLYTGSLGRIEDDRIGFSGELRSAKAVLEQDLVPRTSPTCRAAFCGRGCGLSAVRFTARVVLAEVDADLNRVRIEGIASGEFLDGQIRFLDGPQTGIPFAIVGVDGEWLALDRPLDAGLLAATPAELREGCDHTLSTCANRFGNAVNFRGEPFLPGNDLLARYGQALG
ncbi:DUF2163 domain-containing protein [Qipengyuania sp. S6317L1]|uniref:DUF2163 domain-containing protein n=1 Tax=Qipengyuania sp. S6317L1 TaxID=2926410 RepID=UPI001FF6ADAC|nr:DUF2163 domain-containing protein [Qipengyuania sp. S6317L1]MCK0098889.1 DUF2163 domain-containing protein [Qipengyuania sp. S6317L1]